MPAKSQQQLKLIYAKRDQYGKKSETPEKWKWVWDEEWTDVKFNKLPEKVEEGTSSSLRDDYITYLLDSTNYERDYLESLSDNDLSDLYGEINELLAVHPIDPNAHMEEWTDDAVQEDYFDRDSIIDYILGFTKFEKSDLEKKSEKELIDLFDKVGSFMQVHPGQKLQLQESTCEEDENKVFITKFDKFINESHDHRGPLPIAKKINGKWEIESFDGLAEQASDYEPFEILDVKRDPGYGYEHVVMFFVKFTKNIPKRYQTPENTYGLGIWDMDNKEFIEELGTLEEYGVTTDNLQKKTGFKIPE